MIYLNKLYRASYFPLYFTLLVYLSLIWIQGLSSALYQIVSEFQIALTMVFGSFVAGGTALGGGAVAFPIMTKVLNIEPYTAKVFSLAIQSFGMTAAALTIISRGIPYYRREVLVALPMSAVGIALSLIILAPIVESTIVKAIFSFLLLCFAITMIYRIRGKLHHQVTCFSIQPKKRQIMMVALIGGIASGLVGSGSDIILFAFLVIFCHADMKKATATSVIVMAFVSVLGSVINAWHLNVIDHQIQGYLLAAIPIVVIGAPLGAYVCSKVSVGQLVSFLLLLIAAEVGSTSYHIYLHYH
ncbi:hypothetical protein PPEP_a0840 [Pseudoalteromonas peptidolytica F12-50-A1]|uniref:Probable membrane transporter protein n=1 Tax=Pseudoalteromonas peptidolytica F12-50-A1 TaxID=1315280 RepID=A0A8I0MUX6_9GAMM|nr:hypothetical protein [Pseudoalteromonas peptidolytica F12-50-A1]NLR16047.1 sulfite exporter TauE/SafE family protein [Pseudoalteromonas peptidolytica]GEK08720.1 hypothetical protein PPE03_09690 [Pseudoalteromonas peptidolytica]